MDAEAKEKLTRIEQQFEINKKYDGWLLLDKEDAEFILRLIREQEAKLTNYDKLVEWNHRFRSQLAKYERVIESAKNLVKKAHENKAVTGDNGQPDWYEYSASDFEALTDAIDELEAK